MTLMEQLTQYSDEEIMIMDGFDDAFIGTSQRCGQPRLAVYSWAKMVDILMDRDNMELEEAIEYIDYNCIGAWMGELTPMIVEGFNG